MYAIDTNVLVRLITDDDANMRESAVQLIENTHANAEVLLVPAVVLLELVWVLSARYGFSRTDILNALEHLSRVKGLRFDSDFLLRELIDAGRTSTGDIPDLLIGLCARNSGCAFTWTFDKKAAREALFKIIA
ncbi:MAG TPA: PIN domain-containing protein [Candidatus Hydrogenedentes bacterium]|nr:MAG: tRNA(fMet)-specific endonuclease VapC [Candidatus Hydrogenedentes bacterium ADurb.Bin179]HOH28413.1 PIN domain-containing protein [Candidatus Hydrogenedentota bacterium]